MNDGPLDAVCLADYELCLGRRRLQASDVAIGTTVSVDGAAPATGDDPFASVVAVITLAISDGTLDEKIAEDAGATSLSSVTATSVSTDSMAPRQRRQSRLCHRRPRQRCQQRARHRSRRSFPHRRRAHRRRAPFARTDGEPHDAADRDSDAYTDRATHDIAQRRADDATDRIAVLTRRSRPPHPPSRRLPRPLMYRRPRPR